ncbi:chromate transporter-domain-containing protein [Papiliotrema laurentii]|uniref:Chromate transporter-domain-containing protein n=1 Tax=Papiliotrema laurentii TaxID=5418 RepID=A0AAD9CUL7_PAPLA|nr:chromate transporter-domain-containing protein [Papiliotrema laurentii]
MFCCSTPPPFPCFTSFGGPGVHAIILPVVKHGVAAGLLAFGLWSLPGTFGMAGLAVAVAWIPNTLPDIVDFALVMAHAPWMYPTLIAAGGVSTLVWDFRRHWIRRIKRIGRGRSDGASDQVEMTRVGEQVDRAAEVVGELVTPRPTSSPLNVVSVRVAIALLVGVVATLTVPLATRAGLKNTGRPVPRALDFFSNMIVAGTILFGGGPVVIPLLRDYVVNEGHSRDFLLIFAILQAFPGPNFDFAVALGVLSLPSARPLGALLGYLGIFLPGILLGLLPLYSSWRDKSIARSIIRGLNATASGLVFTAVWQLFLVGHIYQSAEGIQDQATRSGPLTDNPFWAVVGSGSFLATRDYVNPPWLSIAGAGLAGLAWFGVRVGARMRYAILTA